MANPLPSLALEMSMDGIALHQLAFDGHWHELARVGLNDAALREKMANMKEIAQRLEGKRFKTRVWLPADQILRKESDITSDEPKAREAQARQALESITPHSGSDFSVAVSTPEAGVKPIIAAARIKTMLEAQAFAKSHGFTVVAYSTKDPIEGFADKPYFKLPPNKMRMFAAAGITTALVGALIAGAVMFRVSDPYLWWETPPYVADFAPFQQPDIAQDKSNDNILPSAVPLPVFADIAALNTQTLREALPYIPARRLDAVALDTISEPPALRGQEFDITFSEMPEGSRFSLPLPASELSAPSSPDKAPALDLFGVLTEIAGLPDLAEIPDDAQANLPEIRPAPIAQPVPVTIASILFIKEPLPALATTITYALQRELAANFGINVSEIPGPTADVLAQTQLVKIIRGLPEILPRLRDGSAIPPQVAVQQVQPVVTIIETIPADAETVATAARGFRIIEGRPDILPARRFVPPVVIAEDTPPTEPAADAPPDTPPVFTGEIEVVEGQPDLLPVLRSGSAIPEPAPEAETIEQDPASPPAETEIATLETPLDAELQEALILANALRPLRRPQAIRELRAPIDPMLSDAAPAVAVRANHRSVSFVSNAARIAAITADRPHVETPVAPAEPQTVNLPTTASVARAATIENGINLSKTSLIGIFGTADNREVLIRLKSGRILQVSRGDSFSGWRVVAIGEDSIRIQKGSRTEILRMPN